MFDFRIQPGIQDINTYRQNNLKNVASVTRLKGSDYSEPEENNNRRNKTNEIEDFASLLKKYSADRSFNIII